MAFQQMVLLIIMVLWQRAITDNKPIAMDIQNKHGPVSWHSACNNNYYNFLFPFSRVIVNSFTCSRNISLYAGVETTRDFFFFFFCYQV